MATLASRTTIATRCEAQGDTRNDASGQATGVAENHVGRPDEDNAARTCGFDPQFIPRFQDRRA